MAEGYVVALGTFDGIHSGHKAVLNVALNLKQFLPIVVTFREPPKTSQGVATPLLMSFCEKQQRLKQMGFSVVEVLDYESVHELSPQEFLDWLFKKYNIKVVVCGFNYRFGNKASGDVALLAEYCNTHGAECIVVPKTDISGQTVSSTLIRQLIKEGNISFANVLLGEPFSFIAEVIYGDKRGRTMGFPTINQKIEDDIVTPKFGVYASAVKVGDKIYPAVSNVGLRTTYILKKPISETYIIGFNGNVYGEKLEVFLYDFLREERRFENKEELKSAIEADSEKAVQLFRIYNSN